MYNYAPLCLKELISDKNPLVSTYCMLLAGHEGKCSPYPQKKLSLDPRYVYCDQCAKNDHSMHDTSAYKLGCQNDMCDCPVEEPKADASK